MIRHRANHPRIEFVASYHLAQDLEIPGVIQVVEKDVHLVVASRHDVVGQAGGLNTKRSCHARMHIQNRANREVTLIRELLRSVAHLTWFAPTAVSLPRGQVFKTTLAVPRQLVNADVAPRTYTS